MAMSVAQVAAFTAATGGASAANVSMTIRMVLAAVTLLWFGWLVFGAYRAWAGGQVEADDAMWWLLRGAIWVMAVTWLVS